jgi:CubicO group peptidase (beta-lactamase class C family)
MKKHLLLFALILKAGFFSAQALYFPPLSGPAWDTMSPQSLYWCQPRIDSLYNYLQAKNTKSFIVLKNGKIVLEKYFGSYTADSVFYWASSSKSLASFITGIAQQKGFININNPVSQYLGVGWTAASPVQEAQVTVKQLLKMTSGLDDSPPQPCDNEDTAKACLLYLTTPDTRWAYHTGAYRKVQDVVSAAVGQNYNIITNNWVKTKTGMGGIWLNQVYYSKARDMARFGLLALNRGIWATDTILKDSLYFKSSVTTSQSMNPSYGYLWWLNGKTTFMNPGLQFSFPGPLIPNAAPDLFCALGKNDQKIYVVPSQQLVVIRQGNSAEGVTFALSDFDNKLWDYINKLSCTAAGLNEEDQAKQISVYPNPASGSLMIKTEQEVSAATLENMLGERVRLDFNGKSADVSRLPGGNYVLMLQFVNGSRVFKKVIVE